jgi:lysozyme
MSIFRSTFNKTVQGQLNVRQNAFNNRTPQALIQLNSRTSWTRMTSGVNVNGTSDLAKSYILQGGVLNTDKTLRKGVGDQSNAYSTTSPSGNPYNTSARAGAAGIKPMPGITSVDIKSKTAYGSLREVTVNFVCYNIQQLEDLELLYMRPGYTVLIEWGWIPYLDNDGNLKSNINFYNDVLNGGKDKDQIFAELFQRSRDHSGNYDALYGYVKNYSWNARMDGGYDCTTTIISIGEIMESLKIGWIPLDIATIVSQTGLLKASPTAANTISNFKLGITPLSDFTSVNSQIQKGIDLTTNLGFLNNKLAESYSKNILAGLCYELYDFCQKAYASNPNRALVFDPTIPSDTFKPPYNLFVFKYKTNSITNSFGINSDTQAYITLGSFVDLLNKYILLATGKDQETAKPFISLSTSPSAYDDTLVADTANNPENSLLCLAHKLQVSVDPTVCLITNPLWAGGIDTSNINKGVDNGVPTSFDSVAIAVYNDINSKSFLGSIDISNEKNIVSNNIIPKILSTNDAKEFVRSFTAYVRNVEHLQPKYIFDILNKISDGAQRLVDEGKLDQSIYNVIFNINTIATNDAEQAAKNAQAASLSKGQSPFEVPYLKDLQKLGKVFGYKDELGKISNIYLNLDRLYQLSIDSNLQTQSQELNLYQYLKKVLAEVQESIGGVNNFDIHVDPIDNVARIIDVNYIDASARKEIYDKTFQIEMFNTSGSVRSYSLQSQIFPEQSSLVAIGAQVGGGGAQASQNNTLLDFNNNLEDRIMPKKMAPVSSPNVTDINKVISSLKTNLDKIKDFFFPTASDVTTTPIGGADQSINQNAASDYKNALKDVITYFQGITSSNTKNRAIIPVKMALTMDGIGGLIIGHLFKIPPDLLPKGYKSDSVGGKLIQAVTGIGHKIENGDWSTTIDAYNIITNDPKGDVKFEDLISLNPVTGQAIIGTATKVDISKLNLSGGYAVRAFKIIAQFEGYQSNSTWDVNHYRGGYGSDHILTTAGEYIPVNQDTVFTQTTAKNTLIYELQNVYTPRVISVLGQSTWDSLNDNQKAAILSYAYNAGAGALSSHNITSDLQNGRYDLAAQDIARGPITAKGVVLQGLITRRQNESALFSTAV